MKILIVGPSWVGDMVMAQTLFQCLQQRHPGCAIDVLAPEWSRPILERMPEVRQALSFPLGHGVLELATRRTIGKSLAGQYDQAILLPNSLKSALVPFFAGIPKRTGWKGELRYGLLNDIRTLDKERYPLMIERFMALAFEPGAALLAGRGALWLGTGRVYVGLLDDNGPAVDFAHPELMLRRAHALPERLGAHAVGPGRGTEGTSASLLAAALGRDPFCARRPARLDGIAARLAKLPWDAVRGKDVARSAARSERRVAKARRRVKRQPGDDERWHVLRRRLRRLRQQDSLLQVVAPALKPAGGVPAEQAVALGEAQDDALLLRHCAGRSPFPPDIRRAIREVSRARLASVRDAGKQG